MRYIIRSTLRPCVLRDISMSDLCRSNSYMTLHHCFGQQEVMFHGLSWRTSQSWFTMEDITIMAYHGGHHNHGLPWRTSQSWLIMEDITIMVYYGGHHNHGLSWRTSRSWFSSRSWFIMENMVKTSFYAYSDAQDIYHDLLYYFQNLSQVGGFELL